ncbi:Gfo/Idh/MocA family oxidoreductase [Streptomonospora wellingtoniae]|uniref:Gfo/Idh/MocA family oxidoreductase n=1 Tax=Streptomonospora wellingtoniae TaxID=3075544 RepID=A0ABU2KSL3_9ACTN|nr:Gfo/Idh/MocA family oxidoreductase [Streptomonospora sp. DSM 45055]MDT0302201.1 Gfo/Idh/MocA family oxidoreductase [Streptomonospora sp. DSM 45055]
MTSANDAERELQVAVIGYGKGGEVFHAPLVDATPGLRLAAVVTRNPDRQAAVRERYPGAEVLSSADELWKRTGDIDLAVVTTPNETHVPLARAAMEAGFAAVVDKPFALTAAEARALAEDARRLGQVLTVYQNRRWDSDFLTLWKLVEEGALGRVHRFESRFERWRPEVGGTWRDSGDPDAGAGILYDLGPHLIDQAVNLFGPVEAVYAELDARRGAAADDDSFLALTHTGGVRSHLWMSAFAARMGPRFRVLGDRAAFTIDGLDSQEARLNGGERPDVSDWGVEPESAWGRLGTVEESQPVRSERGAYPAFYAGVRDAVGEGEPLPVELHEVVHGLEVIEAARRSARTGQVTAVRSD